jgi:NADPH-dependent glutamate synthase beta subunit-like oxidoreductase
VISDTAIPLRFQTAEVGVDWLQCNIECQEGCPVNTNCRGYLMLAAEGRFEEGYIM